MVPIASGRGRYLGLASVARSSSAALGFANSLVSKSSPVERHVGRLVEAEDGAREFLGHLGAQFGRSIALQYGELLHMIAPVAVFFARGEAEACWHRCALRTAS